MKKIIIVGILLISQISFAQKAVTLKQGQPAPYGGSLLDPGAVAKILAEREYLQNKCTLDAKYGVDKEQTKCKYEVDKAKVELETEKSKNKLILDAKNKELDKLYKMETERKDYSKWWFIGGAAAGVVASVAIFFAVSYGSK